LHYLSKFFRYKYILNERDMYEHAGKTIHVIMRIRVHSSFCMQNLTLAAYTPNFAEVFRTV